MEQDEPGALGATHLGPGGAISTAQLSGGPGRLMGYSIRETTGAAAAVVKVIDGTDANGSLVLTISLNPSESTRDWFGIHGIWLRRACFLQLVSGAAEGNFFYIPQPFARPAGG